MISDLHRPSLIFVSSQVQLSHFHLILSVSSSVLKIQILIDEHVEREILNHRSLRHPNIIRFKEDSDLYPNDPFNQAQNNSSAAGTSTSGRVLPKWNMAASNSMSNRDGEIEDMEDSDDDNGYDYGISQAQKDAIRKRLTSKSQTVLAEVANNWEPGERDYFEDLCMELGLDPDFCIEDVAEDVSETARFFSRLQKDPVVAKPISRK
ncbi:putative non-specific serine/threonine protein kinase [Helianthus annuus]|nr:putative non-specific serine/threonine protein kinase [Helianthus annuus]